MLQDRAHIVMFREATAGWPVVTKNALEQVQIWQSPYQLLSIVSVLGPYGGCAVE
jgi:hypothetical protein